MRKVFLALFVIVGIAAACKKSNSGPDYDPCAVKATPAQAATLKGYMTKLDATATEHVCGGQSTGLFYKIVNPGTGVAPSANSTVVVNYKLSYIKSSDTSLVAVPQPAGPASFPLATLIDGWRKGLPLVKEAGTINLYMAPPLGYGDNASGSIPAGSYLVFEITLLDAQ